MLPLAKDPALTRKHYTRLTIFRHGKNALAYFGVGMMKIKKGLATSTRDKRILWFTHFCSKVSTDTGTFFHRPHRVFFKIKVKKTFSSSASLSRHPTSLS
jgi:hypothetical protein